MKMRRQASRQSWGRWPRSWPCCGIRRRLIAGREEEAQHRRTGKLTGGVRGRRLCFPMTRSVPLGKRDGVRETQFNVANGASVGPHGEQILEVKWLKTIQLPPVRRRRRKSSIFNVERQRCTWFIVKRLCVNSLFRPVWWNIRVHAHRLLRYSLRCIVEMADRTYTSIAVDLSARRPQVVLAL